MRLIDKIAWIEIRDGKILSTLSKGKSKYYIPGGKREIGESDEQTLVREIKEELSVDIASHSMQHIGTFEAQSDGHDEGVTVRMTCYEADYTGSLKPDNEIQEIRWLTTADMGIISAVDQIIFAHLYKLGDLN